MNYYALLSVSNKNGIVDFGEGLVRSGYTIISSGGTHAVLQAEGIPVMKVSEYTGSPEILNGRVKTLHPKIHGGILAQRGNPAHDLDRKANDIGFIDIGGPSMVRSAAKNYKDVTVLTNPQQYGELIEAMNKYSSTGISGAVEELRPKFALEAFKHTACLLYTSDAADE